MFSANLTCFCAVDCLLQHMAVVVCRYSGTVGEFDGSDKHLVMYDDGDEEWVNLTSEKVKLALPKSESYSKTHACSRRVHSA